MKPRPLTSVAVGRLLFAAATLLVLACAFLVGLLAGLVVGPLT